MMQDPAARPGPSVRDEINQQISPEEAADVAVHAVDELADQAADLDALRREVQDLGDQLLRRAAEFQNYRRRNADAQAQAEARGTEKAVAPLLGVFDDLRRSVEASRQTAEGGASPSPAFSSLAEGVGLVYQKFEEALVRLGVEPIEAVGQPFDVDAHEAVMQQPAPEGTAPGTVLAEVQRGYRLGERVLRHASVIVAQ